MGDVLTVFEILPEEIDSIETIKSNIAGKLPEKAEVAEIREEPIAFGLKKLLVGIKTPDEPGLTDKVEEALQGITGVGQITITAMTLI